MPPEQKEVAFLEKIKQSFYIIMNSRISLCTRCFYLPLLGFFFIIIIIITCHSHHLPLIVIATPCRTKTSNYSWNKCGSVCDRLISRHWAHGVKQSLQTSILSIINAKIESPPYELSTELSYSFSRSTLELHTKV